MDFKFPLQRESMFHLSRCQVPPSAGSGLQLSELLSHHYVKINSRKRIQNPDTEQEGEDIWGEATQKEVLWGNRINAEARVWGHRSLRNRWEDCALTVKGSGVPASWTLWISSWTVGAERDGIKQKHWKAARGGSERLIPVCGPPPSSKAGADPTPCCF